MGGIHIMGVDLCSCDNCRTAFTDYDEGWTQCDCGLNWCSSKCAEEDGFQADQPLVDKDGE